MEMRQAKIQMIGAGSLGSYTALFLASMGFNRIEVWDDDMVEFHNRRNQLFRVEDFQKPKVTALQELVRYLTGIEIMPRNARANQDTEFAGVVVVMVDSMAARKTIFEAVKYNPRVHLFVDARSGGYDALVYAVNPMDPDGVKRYEESLYSDEEAAPIPCSDQTTLSTVWTVAAVASRMIQLWSEGKIMPVCEEVQINYQKLPVVDSHHLSL